MSLFSKCDSYTFVHEAVAAGVFPYFQAISESTATEACIEGQWRIMVGSNNYLGLTHHPDVLAAATSALHRYGSGSTGSRFLNGTLDLHYELEARFARFYNKEAALVFTTGYQANLGVIAPLVCRGDHLFLDKFDHASLVDGARLTLGEVHRYPHGDFDSLDRQLSRIENDSDGKRGGVLIATDGVFSMEGSIVDLPRLVPVARKHGAHILIDDAHALGVLGDNGGGTARHFGLDDEVDLIMATFSKSLASIGGVLVGPEAVIHYVRHHARSLIFTASMPPASVAGALVALDILQREPERRERLWANTRRVADGLQSLGYDIGTSTTPIIPVLVGDWSRAFHFWRALFDEGVFTHPIIPPAVAPNACRIRVSMSAEHTDEQVDRVLEAFARVARRGVAPAVTGGEPVGAIPNI